MSYFKKFRFFNLLILLLVIGLLSPNTTFAAATWTERTTGGSSAVNWHTDSDADGSNLIAAGYGDHVYTSSNGGANWTQRQPAGVSTLAWNTVASDEDGSNLIAAVENGRIYTSSDSGVNWTERRPSGNTDYPWISVGSDADGSTLMAAYAPGRLFTSSDGGANWTERQPAGNTDVNWQNVNSDSSGSNLVTTGSRIYTSSDGGANWTERQPKGNSNGNWQGLAINSDVTKIMAGDYGGRLYFSSNSGVSWSELQPVGAVNRSWRALGMSNNGSYLIAGIHDGRIYSSTNGGTNWEQEFPKGNVNAYWYNASVSTDSTKVLISEGPGGTKIYTGVNDSTAPAVSTLSPADNATAISTTANLVITFDEAVDAEAGADNDIVIKKSSDDSVIETIDAQDAKVTGTGTTTITVNPAATLSEQTAYYVQIGADAFDDAAGNSYAGISNTTSWNFTTGDFTAPTVSTFSPVDNAENISITSDLIITFSEAVDAETGNITIKKSSDSSVIETINVISGNVTGSGTATITINPVNDLNYETGYYINIDATAFDDVNSNSYAGIADATAWTFTTVVAPSSSGSSSGGSSPSPVPVFTPPPPAPPSTPPVTPIAPSPDASVPAPTPSPSQIPESAPVSTPSSPSFSDQNSNFPETTEVIIPDLSPDETTKQNITYTAVSFIRDITENSATKIIGKVAIVVPVTISAIVLFSGLLAGMPFLNYLFYLLVVAAQILGIKKTPKPWGTVYDSETKRPIPFARVEILNEQNRKLQTAVTDQNGRYGFLLPEGLSKGLVSLQAFRTKYDFPSKVIPTPIDQSLYPNIYKGGQINAVNNLANFDIPMDPRSQSPTRNFYFGIVSVNLNNAITRFADVLFVAGGIFSVTNAIVRPNGTNFLILAVVAFTFLVRQSGFKLKPFGLTKNKETNQVLPFGFVSLYNQAGERVGFTVSDDMGRYFLLSPKGKYTLKAFTPAHILPARAKEIPIFTNKGWISKEIGL